MSDRTRFEINLNETAARDRRIAEWIDWQMSEGRNVAELIKNVLDEIITGRSALTGRQISYDGDMPVRPDAGDDLLAQKLANFGD